MIERGWCDDHTDEWRTEKLGLLFGMENVLFAAELGWVIKSPPKEIDPHLGMEIADGFFKPPRTITGSDITPEIKKFIWG